MISLRGNRRRGAREDDNCSSAALADDVDDLLSPSLSLPFVSSDVADGAFAERVGHRSMSKARKKPLVIESGCKYDHDDNRRSTAISFDIFANGSRSRSSRHSCTACDLSAPKVTMSNGCRVGVARGGIQMM